MLIRKEPVHRPYHFNTYLVQCQSFNCSIETHFKVLMVIYGIQRCVNVQIPHLCIDMPVSQSDTGQGRLISVLDWHRHFFTLVRDLSDAWQSGI
jgi:hypothetical protein